jgi:hypothetical protein
MNKRDFNTLFVALNIFKPCPIHFNYDNYFTNYKSYFIEYQIYLKKAKKTIVNNKQLIVLFLESGPENSDNYIFSSLTNQINPASDSFLWNICKGFGLDPREKTKETCLIWLYSRDVPVLIIDLFPFHGINLSKKKNKTSYRSLILHKFKRDQNSFITALKDPIDILRPFKGDKIFLFGVPNSFWNSFGGPGKGSIWLTDLKKKSGPLGGYSNKTNIVNVGGQTISSAAIKSWCEIERV